MSRERNLHSEDYLSELLENKYVRIGMYISGGLLFLYGVGIVCKVLSHSLSNYKELQKVIRS